MDENTLLEQLEEVARSLGIEVRHEVLKGEGSFSPGGLCRLQGKYLLILNSRATQGERIQAMASAINGFDLTRIYLKPGVREFLERLAKKKEHTSE